MCKILTSLLQLISCLIVAIERPRTAPASLICIHALNLLVQTLLLTTHAQPLDSLSGCIWLVEICIPLIILLIILNMPFRDPKLGSEGIGKPFDTPSADFRSPEDMFTLWQWMTISWMTPLISIGESRQIHEEDIWFLPIEFQHEKLHRLFRELKGSVTYRLMKANGLDLIITSFLGISETLASMSEIILLKCLLAALQGDQPNVRVAVIYAILTLFGRWIAAQSAVFSLWFSRRCYERSRGEMITMIYEKTLRRKAFTIPSDTNLKITARADPEPDTSGSATPTEDRDTRPYVKIKPTYLQWLKSKLFWGYQKVPTSPTITTEAPASTGKILNLMRNDVYEVAQRFWEVQTIFTVPLSFVVSIVLVVQLLGPTSLLGLLVLVLVNVINAIIVRVMLRIERERRRITDTKLQLTSQFVEAIRHLRWYDWQDSWLLQILESRQMELTKRLISTILGKTIFEVNSLGHFMFPVVVFFAYTSISGNELTVDIAFPALNLFTILQKTATDLPQLITVLLNARVAMGRIESFMAEPEKEIEGGDYEEITRPHGALEISIHNASFSWPGSQRKVLRDVDIIFQPGLTVVCGKVGIGKTALLHAILGELDQYGGMKNIPDEMIGLTNQSPWLQSMSIRENILFSAQYDERRYRKVLDACCLLPDLESFKAGDLSMIGENGIGLSGGQKARVALARAVYSKARILLLDDPIAALDHQTAETILRKLTKGDSALFAGRIVVFVTHRIDLIATYADSILDVVDGGFVKTISKDELGSDQDLKLLISETKSDLVEDEAIHGETAAIPDKFIEEEYRPHGGVMATVYWQYIKAGGFWWWVSVLVAFALFRASRVAYFWFLKKWGEAYESPALWDLSSLTTNKYGTIDFETALQVSRLDGFSWFDPILRLPSPSINVNPWIFWFFVLSIAQVVTTALSDVGLIVIMYRASKRIFSQAMHRVTNATFRFYDITPVGRLMNRLTSDIGTIDGPLTVQLMEVTWQGVGWLSSVFVIGTTTPLFLVLTITMTGTFVYIFMRFLPTSQSLRRLEMVSLSPLMSNFGTLLDGLTTVRAFKAQPHFQNRIIATTDNFQKMDHFYWSLQSWLQYRFDLLSAVSTFTLTMTAILSGLSPGSVGFVLAAASNFVSCTHILCRKYGELQMQFVSVERVIELLNLDQEPQGERKPPSAWPTYSDDIEFDDVTLRYAPQLEPSLKNVSFRIPAGSTVAVTGRTGSGKSTLALSLLGTLLPDQEGGGHIRIGNIDIKTVDKRSLRRRITFVAQDPVLFPGTLRDNLDPQNDHSDEECAAVLSRVLDKTLGDFHLGSRVDGGGKNLSQGQRQLVGLGRAILRRSPVVILDEVSLDFGYPLQRFLTNGVG
jgi:ABC-type multidrug transport system fused ATPase/permease subunit